MLDSGTCHLGLFSIFCLADHLISILKAYNEGLIDESFSYDFTMEKGFGFAMIGVGYGQPRSSLRRQFEKRFKMRWKLGQLRM